MSDDEGITAEQYAERIKTEKLIESIVREYKKARDNQPFVECKEWRDVGDYHWRVFCVYARNDEDYRELSEWRTSADAEREVERLIHQGAVREVAARICSNGDDKQ